MANGRVINNSAYISPSENVTEICPPGDYNGTVIYEGTDKYQETRKTLIITVPDHSGLVKAEIEETEIKTLNNTIIIHVNAENNLTIDCGIISLTINGKTYTNTVENGYSQFDNLNLNTGITDANVKYNCNNNHYTNTTKEITINKGDTLKIKTNNITTTYNLENKITGILLDEYNNPITNVTINITISKENKSKTYTVKTNDAGEYILDINLAPEIYSIKTTYNNISENSELIINKATAKISTNDYTGTYGVEGNFTGVIISNEKAVEGEIIGLNLTRLSNNLWKVYYVSTDENGRYSLPINLAPGRYSAQTIVSSNKYNSSSIVNSMIIY